MNKKYLIKACCSLLAGVMMIGSFSACQGNKDEVSPDPEYTKKVGAYEIWKNTPETAIPQYKIYNLVHSYLDDCEISQANAVKGDKVRKVLFLGFDGMRADAVAQLLTNTNEFDGSKSATLNSSGINTVAQQGGVYLAYCGGEKGTETEQTTSTSASWTSEFTGVWGVSHGIKTNDDSKNMKYKTFMLEYAEKGLNTAVAFDWDQYFDVNIKEEVKYVMENDNIPMVFCDTDREKKDKLKDTYAETLELYNFVAPDEPSPSAPYDSGIRDWTIAQIESGTDIVCGIFHNVDTAGHTYEFSVNNPHYMNSAYSCDRAAYDILQVVYQREKEYNEEWLVIFANDHGGINQGHGEQSDEERTTWIATNREISDDILSSQS